MVLTERLRENVGGVAFRIFQITAVSGGISYAITAASLNMSYIDWACYKGVSITVTANCESIPTLKISESSAGGTNISLSAHAASGESGVLMVWGKQA